jgi:hypothetical protein
MASLNRLHRLFIATTAAISLLLLGLAAVSRTPEAGFDVELVELKAAAQHKARHLCVRI